MLRSHSIILAGIALLALLIIAVTYRKDHTGQTKSFISDVVRCTLDQQKEVPSEDLNERKLSSAPVQKTIADNSAAKRNLDEFQALFQETTRNSTYSKVIANPNDPKTIKLWWQAAAMIDSYLSTRPRYKCKNKTPYGNWHACQDPPYEIKPPCLVYSFGINGEWQFDDAMGKLGCEVHSFDPSMGVADHKRSENITFYNMGLANFNSDHFLAVRDIYVTKEQFWKVRTLKSLMREIGHENRIIDLLKMDVEVHEWNIVDNLIETDMFRFVRQFSVEWHFFANRPPKEDFVLYYNVYTRLREMGFLEYSATNHSRVLNFDKFNNQGETQFVNFLFKKAR